MLLIRLGDANTEDSQITIIPGTVSLIIYLYYVIRCKFDYRVVGTK